jgi:succinyl-diaminopimelate desuccinylase
VSDTDLLDLTAEFVDIPSLSHHEGALADRIEAALAGCGWLEVLRLGDNVVARTRLDRPQRMVLAGHLDTVPPANNERARIAGDTLHGLGAADMKGGLAVMLDVATTLSEPSSDLTWCFYVCEEIERQANGLGRIFAEQPDWLVGNAAILGEPTDCVVEAGCQGSMRVVVHIGGIRAHSARPFAGRNAIHRLAPVLTAVAGWEPRSVVLDGCEYTEQLQAVGVSGGVANNVVPDAATLTLNYRYAPDGQGQGAAAVIEGLLDGLLDETAGDSLRVVDQADGAPPSLDHPVLAALVAATGSPARAKVGWTDVASFFAQGVPAANFGPGDPLLAHHPDERVERSSLERARAVLTSLLSAPG